MARYKIGDQVISRPKSNYCAPAGEICAIVAVIPVAATLYEVITPDGSYRNYEDELEPLISCEYCKKGKKFNSIYFGDTRIESYILGNRLNTDVSDAGYPDEEDGTSERITHCPFCGEEVHEAPDEEIEEVLE